MRLSFRLKHHFFNAFRELFVHHHGSLEFRAKLFALMIATNEHIDVENYILVKKLALEIYKNDEDRANLLLLLTKELVRKIKEKKYKNLDSLIFRIQKELKIVPRYARKIDLKALEHFIDLADNQDTQIYQHNIIEFLTNLKNETLKLKKD
jgi:hypothetical protein